MAHFAKLDEDNFVVEVHCVANEALDLQNEEASGIAFLTEWSSGHINWKQTSYNATIRKNYAGIGYSYDEARDAFIAPKPYGSWILDEDTCNWQAPVAKPDDTKTYAWDEELGNWVEAKAL
jgi:hypothetical protein